MRNPKEAGALITADPAVAAQCLIEGKVVSTTFGPRIYAIHVQRGDESVMAGVKGRENGKPFVTTTHPKFVETALLEKPGRVGIDKNALPQVLDWLNKLLTSSPDHPIGVLLSTEANFLSDHQVGEGNIKIDGKPQRTIGFMTPGNDQDYFKFIEQIPKKLVSSTSVNKGGDPNAGGSGHHRLHGIVQDFGKDDRVCVTVPNAWSEKTRVGVSTTTFFLNADGARLVRVGSMRKEDAIGLCTNLNIPYRGEIDGNARKIKPFDYTKRSPETEMAAAYQHIRERTRADSFEWTAEAEKQCEAAVTQALLAFDYAAV